MLCVYAIYIYIYIYIHTHTLSHAYACMCVYDGCVYPWMYVCTYVCMYVCMYVCTYPRRYVLQMSDEYTHGCLCVVHGLGGLTPTALIQVVSPRINAWYQARVSDRVACKSRQYAPQRSPGLAGVLLPVSGGRGLHHCLISFVFCRILRYCVAVLGH